MVDKTPAELDPGTPSDTSIVHASENGVSTNSKGHDERDISRLQGTAPLYSSSKTYNVNDLVTESGTVFRNITAIAIPETFTPSKWVAISGGSGDRSFVFRSLSTNTVSTETLSFYQVSGSISGASTNEVDRTLAVPNDAIYSRLTVDVNINAATSDTLFRFRVNGADGNQLVTFPALTTGIIQDLSNTDSVLNADEINYSLVKGTGGDITVVSLGMEQLV